MRKYNWKLIIVILTMFLIFLLMIMMGSGVIELRGINCGRPDPAFLFMAFMFVIVCVFVYFVARWQYNSFTIYTEVGVFYSHNQEPLAILDPLNLIKNQNLRSALTNKRLACYSEKNYDPKLNALKKLFFYIDLGAKFLRVHGLRWYLGGYAILIAPHDFFINYGGHVICLASVKVYKGKDYFKLPQHIRDYIQSNIPQFRPGKHIVVFGNLPLPKAIRAKVLANANISDKEPDYHNLIEVRPKWIWSLGFMKSSINTETRAGWITQLTNQHSSEASGLRQSFEFWDEYDSDNQQNQPGSGVGGFTSQNQNQGGDNH